MTADIVERLRGMAATVRNGGTLPEFADARLMQEAAQEILRLRALTQPQPILKGTP